MRHDSFILKGTSTLISSSKASEAFVTMLSLLKATALLTAGFSAFASADEVHIDSVSPSVSVGQKVNVTWTSDANYVSSSHH